MKSSNCRISLNLFAALSLAFFSSGCAKFSAQSRALSDVNNGLIAKTSRPACEVQPAEYSLSTKVVGFELTSSGGVHAGFSLLSGFLKLLNLDFKAASGSMTLTMALVDPIHPQLQLASSSGTGTFVSYGAAVDAGFTSVGAGFNVDHHTPLSALAENSLSDGFLHLTQQLASVQEAWHTEVMAIPTDTSVVVPVGAFVGLKVGDQFVIYNVQHIWSGEPCNSDHIIARKTTAKPLAMAQAVQVANSGAVLELVCTDQSPCNANEKIEVGATVEISQLTDDKRTLYRLLEVQNIAGANIPYDNGQSVDVSSYLKDLTSAVARSNGFMVYTPGL